MSVAPLIKDLNLVLESNMKMKYSLDISIINSNLKIIIKSINKMPYIAYEDSFDLETVKKINKYFLICETIADVIYSIQPNLKLSKLREDKNKIELIIPLNHPLCKEAIFTIKEKRKDIYESIAELYDIINDLKITISNQQNTINRQENEIIQLKEKIRNLEKKEKKEENIIHYFDDSLIISNNKNAQKNIKNWINPNKNISFKLIFRKSRDGSDCSNFHKSCENQGPTLSLFQTNKTYIFGGYTPFSWKNTYSLGPENDNSTFLFSIDLMQKFDRFQNGNTVFSNFNYGPCFGNNGGDLYLKKDLNSGFTKSGNILRNCELTNGERGDFITKEFEVYKVEFN